MQWNMFVLLFVSIVIFITNTDAYCMQYIDQLWLDNQFQANGNIATLDIETDAEWFVHWVHYPENGLIDELRGETVYGLYVWGTLQIDAGVCLYVETDVDVNEEYDNNSPYWKKSQIVVGSHNFGEGITSHGQILANGSDGEGMITFTGGTLEYSLHLPIGVWNGFVFESEAGESDFQYCNFFMGFDPTNWHGIEGVGSVWDDVHPYSVCMKVLGGGFVMNNCYFRSHAKSILEWDWANETEMTIANTIFNDYSLFMVPTNVYHNTRAGVDQCVKIVNAGALTFWACTFQTAQIKTQAGAFRDDHMSAIGVSIGTENGPDCDANVTIEASKLLTIATPIIQSGTGQHHLILQQSEIRPYTGALIADGVPPFGSGGIVLKTGSSEIKNNIIGHLPIENYSFEYGIQIFSDASVSINNNFIFGARKRVNFPIAGTGIYIDPVSELEENNVRIFNNIIFRCEKDGIGMSQDARVDVVYNTFHRLGEDGIHIYNDQTNDDNSRIYNNIFSIWNADGDDIDYAIEYEDDSDVGDEVDNNVYFDPLLDYYGIHDGESAGEGAYTLHVSQNSTGNGGPQQVAYLRTSISPMYFAWDDEENGQMDDISGGFILDNINDEQYDFHSYDMWWHNNGDPVAGIPPYLNEAYSAEWWEGYDRDPNLPANVWLPLSLYGNTSLPDPGAYGGPFANYWYRDGYAWIITNAPQIVSYTHDVNDYAEPINEVEITEPILTEEDWYLPYTWVDQEEFYYDQDYAYRIEDELLKPTRNDARILSVGDTLDIVPGSTIIVPPSYTYTVNGGVLRSLGRIDAPINFFCSTPGENFGGFYFNSGIVASNVQFTYTNIYRADYGAYLNGVTATTARLTFDHCTFDSCGVGVYANNSRLLLDSCTIKGSYASTTFGAGVYLNNCASGKVVIEGCTIDSNGTGSTVSSAGIYLASSSPEIIWTVVKDNSGGGIYCTGSTPDLNTLNGSNDQPNTIESNGTGGQGGSTSDGSEIYLVSSSYPLINYNNISDGSPTPNGYLIYKNSTTSTTVNAKNNWWNGYAPSNSWFYWGTGGAISYSPYSTTKLSSAEEFDVAMELWDAGEYADAAEHFRNCVADTGTDGVNSVHYLAGCVGMIANGDYNELRGFLQDAAAEHPDPEVAKTALRFATDCLTQQGLYEDAMDEYDARRANASCLEDSILAVVDYLSVYELAHGGDLDAVMGDIPSKMSQLLASLDGAENGKGGALPTEVALMGCYPNPFNGITTINFALPQAGDVKLGVYDMAGREVTRLAEGRREAGTHRVSWQADGVPTGVYLVRLESAGAVQSMKAMLVK